MLEIQYLAWMGKSIIYIKREKERDVNLMDRGEVRLSLSQTKKNPGEFAGYYTANRLLRSSNVPQTLLKRPRTKN